MGQAIVFFEDGAKFFVGKRHDFVIFDAGHGFGGDHSVDDGLFGSLDGGGKDGIQGVVGQKFQVDHFFALLGVGIGRGESDEDVAGAVAGNAAVATETERDAACETF